ncbi:hypothetical protein Ddye_016324 [Dipteronia dyeriana]|uniref:Uncharacterized protein n=1 Tax=Dipteronia dyeriana TaxID=168575 RepID=A0AAD9U7C0_9ROSI|nr:hypothetical protein Ddye_016324 [Dipteronia dyeriana]
MERRSFLEGTRSDRLIWPFGWIAGWLGAMEAVGVKLLEPDSFPCLQTWIQNLKEVGHQS